MIDTLITELAKALGIGPQYIEGSLLTLALLVLVLMARTLLTQNKNESKQINFQERLVNLTSEAIEESKKQRLAYEKNNEILVSLKDILIDLGKSFATGLLELSAQTVALKTAMEKHDQEVEHIATNFKTQIGGIESTLQHRFPSEIIIRDSDGAEVLRFKLELKINDAQQCIYTATAVAEIKTEEVKS